MSIHYKHQQHRPNFKIVERKKKDEKVCENRELVDTYI